MDDINDFGSAVEAVKGGRSSVAIAEHLLQLCTEEEQLSLLDGDPKFWQGLQMLYAGHYFSEPFVHGEIKRLGIPGIRYSDGPRGITINKATVFPIATARAATWDLSLEEKVGRAMGTEARVHGANTVGSVCINLARHPAWGRAQEAYGEDPLLLGEFGAAHVRGLKHNVMACVKHLALNSMETARFRVDVRIDDDALHEVYLPHFKRCIEEGAPAVMSAYNAVNGHWAGESYQLLTGILRKLWGFDGFVISDWVFGMRDGVKSIKAGLDIEAPFQNRRAQCLKEALAKGDLLNSDITVICRRILATQLRHYASRQTLEPQKDVIFCHEHRQLSREVAAKAIVLLKNEELEGQKLLPLPEKIRKYALIGRSASTAVTGDQASSWVDCPVTVSPYEALSQAISRNRIILSDSASIPNARQAANQADISIVIVGYDGHDEGEFLKPSRQKDSGALEIFPPFDDSPFAQSLSAARETGKKMESAEEAGKNFRSFHNRPVGGDRRSVRLNSEDVELIKAVVKTNPRTVVCIRTAGAVIIEEWQSLVPAILINWYGGSDGGSALVDILFGKISPSGKLPWSMPTSEQHLPEFDSDADNVKYDKWFGQRLLDRLGVSAAFPLGYGLSYTDFRLEKLTMKPNTGSKTRALTVAVKIANLGGMAGRSVVQAYGHARFAVADPNFPGTVLMGFQSIELGAGQSSWVEVPIHTTSIQRWRNGRLQLDAYGFELEVGQYAHDPKALRLNYSFPQGSL
ncbi:hypothetical protein IQ07DRAFT_153654 [Pyrenochaeta sp. DS3sAY3a]|nr:hypothetical protein IQ07DRAFT_153654 [Pyrenochaeta sp. DS3sAY3a]